MKTVILGDVSQDLAFFAKKYQSTLATINNLHDATTDSQNYYTSFGDLGPNDIVRLVKSAKKIIIQPKRDWTNNQLLKTTVYHCRYFNHFINVENLDFYDWLNFVYRPTFVQNDHATLWLFGGSNVQGNGLFDRRNRYGELLGQMRNMNIVDCSKVGTGLRRSFETLISATVKKDDIVILDTTLPTRIRMCQSNTVSDINLHNCSRDIVLSMSDDQLFYNQISCLDAFVKLCSAVEAKLVFYSHQSAEHRLLDYYMAYSKHRSWALEASLLASNPLDKTKCDHFGPDTHRSMANLLNQHITRVYENSNIWG